MAVPVIDLAQEDHVVAEQIRQACEVTGFFYVRSHGVSAALRAAFDATREYFQLPRSVLDRHERDPRFRRGLQPIGATRHPGRAPDLKESYDVGVDLPLDHPTVAADLPLHGPNQWPEPAEAPGFREASEEYFDAASRLGQRLLGLFALSLGMPRDFLTQHTTNPMVQMRLFHYPTEPPPSFGEVTGLGAAPHTDFGMITLLAPDPVGGLEVRTRGGDEWVSVPHVEGTLIVNIGDIFQRWTNDVYVSNQHRVISPPGQPRHSIAVFYHLDHDTPVRCIPTCLEGDEEPKYPEIKYLDYLVSRFNAVQQLGVEQEETIEKVGHVTPPDSKL